MRLHTSIPLVIVLLLLIVGGLLWFVNRSILAMFTEDPSVTSENQKVWRFAVIGDTENMHEITQRIIEDIRAQKIDFLVHVGDVSSNAEASDLQEVKTAFDSLPMPTYYVPGNNDLFFDETIGERSSATYTAVIQQPLNQYIEHNNARLVLLDNAYRKYGFREETLSWLSEQLARHSEPEHTFVFFHRPLHLPLEDVFGDDETVLSRKNNKTFLEILSKYSIDYIFNGHIHLYIPYTLQGIPVVVSGGGGAYPQDMLGGKEAAYFHYIIVHVPYSTSQQPWVTVRPID